MRDVVPSSETTSSQPPGARSRRSDVRYHILKIRSSSAKMTIPPKKKGPGPLLPGQVGGYDGPADGPDWQVELMFTWSVMCPFLRSGKTIGPGHYQSSINLRRRPTISCTAATSAPAEADSR
jgi:hypothetical protein